MSSPSPALLVLGSHRQNGNAAGIQFWFQDIWDSRSKKRPSSVPLHPATAVAASLPPEGPVVDPTIPALINSAEGYSDPAISAWSTRVRESSALIILTPQYNWGYPGPLKNAIDHLYWEWRGKPVLLITYGGHGGTKCSRALKTVLSGGVKANVVKVMNITLPDEFVRGEERVKSDNIPKFLQGYTGEAERAVDALLDAVANSQEGTLVNKIQLGLQRFFAGFQG